MYFDDLELLADAAALRSASHRSMVDDGVGPVCAEATTSARADGPRAVAAQPARWTAAERAGAARQYDFTDASYADTGRPAHTDAARSARAGLAREDTGHAREREGSERKPVNMYDAASERGVKEKNFCVDFGRGREDTALHEHVYNSGNAARSQHPKWNRDVPEELLIEFDGLYSTTDRRAAAEQLRSSQRDQPGSTWGRERAGPYCRDTPAGHPGNVSPHRRHSPSPEHGRDLTSNRRFQDSGTKLDSLKYSVGAKLGTYNGSTCLGTFLAKFENCSEYFNWSVRDRLFHLKASLEGPAGQLLWNVPKDITVDRLIELLRNRFDTENKAERYRAELRARKRQPNESLQSLYHDIA